MPEVIIDGIRYMPVRDLAWEDADDDLAGLLGPRGNLTTQVVRNAMGLACSSLPDERQMEYWTPLERKVAYDWAMREHLHASDNQVLRRARPSFTIPGPSGNSWPGGTLAEAPARDMTEVAALMRSEHPEGHPRHRFWESLACWLGGVAYRDPYIEAADWTAAVSISRAYREPSDPGSPAVPSRREAGDALASQEPE